MTGTLSRGEAIALGLAVVLLTGVSVWQARELRAARTEEQKALYAERLRTAQVIVENEMLGAAWLTTLNGRTRDLAREALERSPY